MNDKSKLTEGMFTSRTEEWETPQYVFDKLNEEFHFDLDVCATQDNAKCKRYFTKEDDGLSQIWTGVCWMNPPYGREIYRWMKKAWMSAVGVQRATVVCLVHARTDTKWWHDFVTKASVVRFIKGRLKFGDGKQSAPFPSCIIIFNGVQVSQPTIEHISFIKEK